MVNWERKHKGQRPVGRPAKKTSTPYTKRSILFEVGTHLSPSVADGFSFLDLNEGAVIDSDVSLSFSESTAPESSSTSESISTGTTEFVSSSRSSLIDFSLGANIVAGADESLSPSERTVRNAAISSWSQSLTNIDLPGTQWVIQDSNTDSFAICKISDQPCLST